MNNQSGSIQFLFLQWIPIALSIGLCVLSYQHARNQKVKLEKLCYTQILLGQSHIANRLNWIENTYNKEAKELNTQWDTNEQALKFATDPRIKAALLVIKYAIEWKQWSLHIQMQRKWQTAIKERNRYLLEAELTWKQIKQNISITKKSSPLLLVPKDKKHISPEYHVNSIWLYKHNFQVSLSAYYLRYDFENGLLKKLLHEKVSDRTRKMPIACSSKIERRNQKWVAKLAMPEGNIL